ncbi:hypothetical protein BIW11_12996 [Tropilaelaps mercedesae]|uniref:Uncharacterized protein n=1 Tax=Tropilaelaps mercedesae TaxID=418985 RepID=A0A1V9X480_9ACAR|nr:hypothetical protein BIW11_12996 [Tropilaelaps mercedesae]
MVAMMVGECFGPAVQDEEERYPADSMQPVAKATNSLVTRPALTHVSSQLSELVRVFSIPKGSRGDIQSEKRKDSLEGITDSLVTI